MVVLLASLGALAALLLGGTARAATPTVTEFSDGLGPNPTILGLSPAPDGKVWFADQGGSSDNTLGSINPFNQIISEVTPGVNSALFGVSAGPDGNLYTAGGDLTDNVIGLIPSTGDHRLTYLGGGNPAEPRFSAAGPDGNIWFTEPRPDDGTTSTTDITHQDKVGVATPHIDLSKPDNNSGGGPTYFLEAALPANGFNSNPEEIAAGPTDTSASPAEGLWVTETAGNKIARLLPVFAGPSEGAIVAEYGGLTTGAQPEDIVLGPDGNLWFTEFGKDKVGRLIPPPTPTSGGAGTPTIDEFPLPAGQSQPVGIAAGPDGNLWIAENSGHIVRMNTSGTVTGDFTTPGTPEFITTGADGNLWFGDVGTSTIGRITTGLDPPAFSNTAQITDPASGQSGVASPYPSTVNVSGLQGRVSKVTVRLTGISHTFPRDLDVLLVGPQGQKVVVLAGAGSPGNTTSYPANGITLNFSDDAPRQLSSINPLVSGFYKPTDLKPGLSQTEFNTPAPPSPYGTSLSGFNGTDPNGTWKLFVIDDSTHTNNTNIGKIFGGWGLDIDTTDQLFVGKSGAGSGTVISAPPGIDCGGACSTSFASGSTVVLTATPSAGSQFASWQGCDSVSGNQCTIAMNDGIENVTANFGVSTGPTGPTGTNPTPTPAPIGKKKCKKAKKRAAVAAKKCKKRK
jgi:streptogramin lyase/subtilisin-like proprotein convertase family protein